MTTVLKDWLSQQEVTPGSAGSIDHVEWAQRVINRLRELEIEISGLGGEVADDITHAESVVLSTYGDTVSVTEKKKNLNKFGRNRTVGTSVETVAEMQGTTSEETFVTTDLIDSISSSDETNDVGLTFTIEGHTIDASGNLTFVVQDVTLDGTDARTEVALTTPLARATRLYVKASGTFDSPQDAPTGTIYVYDNTGGQTNGVPDTASQTKVMLLPGNTQSEKCATSVSSSDYWFIRYFSASIGDTVGNAAFVTVRMETRDVANGGVWRPLGTDYTLWEDTVGIQREFSPFLIVPKNHDWRVIATSNSNTAEVYAEAGGYLAAIQ